MTCDSYHTTVLCMYRTAAAIQCSDGVYGILCGRVAWVCVSEFVCVGGLGMCMGLCMCTVRGKYVCGE